MKKFPIFVAALIPLLASAAGETEKIPSLVVGHYYGVDSYPVHLSDYNRIELGETHYTLKANSGNTADDIKLSYEQYPRFWVEDVASDLPTSLPGVAADKPSVLTYKAMSQSIESSIQAPLAVAVYDVSGGIVLSREVSAMSQLSVGSLPAGLYLVRADEGSQVYYFKFVKH